MIRGTHFCPTRARVARTGQYVADSSRTSLLSMRNRARGVMAVYYDGLSERHRQDCGFDAVPFASPGPILTLEAPVFRAARPRYLAARLSRTRIQALSTCSRARRGHRGGV